MLLNICILQNKLMEDCDSFFAYLLKSGISEQVVKKLKGNNCS